MVRGATDGIPQSRFPGSIANQAIIISHVVSVVLVSPVPLIGNHLTFDRFLDTAL